MAGRFCSDVKVSVCVLTALFGIGSWIAINGIWAELPLIVEELPEGWNLPSFMTVIILPATFGPIAITICNILNRQPPEKVLINVMVVVGSVAMLLLAFFWQVTSYIAGAEHSTVLFVLLFILCLVDCTTPVVFLPFMNNFKPRYLISYYIGEGFSGLLPSVVALIQGVGQVNCVNISTTNSSSNDTEYTVRVVYESPVFSVNEFFLFLFGTMVLCGLSFTMLNYLPYCKSEHVKTSEEKDAKDSSSSSTDIPGSNDGTDIRSTQNIIELTEKPPARNSSESKLRDEPTRKEMSNIRYAFFLFLIGWINAVTNGVLPSIQPYACLPYGSLTYHLAVQLSNIANPLACFAAFFLPISSATAIGLLTLVGSGFAVYIIVLAALSPVPPLVSSVFGSALVVIAFVAVSLVLSFTKVVVTALFRTEGRRALVWCGAVNQLGSTVGSIAMFVTVNVYKLFTQKYPCT